MRAAITVSEAGYEIRAFAQKGNCYERNYNVPNRIESNMVYFG